MNGQVDTESPNYSILLTLLQHSRESTAVVLFPGSPGPRRLNRPSAPRVSPRTSAAGVDSPRSSFALSWFRIGAERANPSTLVIDFYPW